MVCLKFQNFHPTSTNYLVVLFLAVGNIRANADAIACPTIHKFHALKWFRKFANVATR